MNSYRVAESGVTVYIRYFSVIVRISLAFVMSIEFLVEQFPLSL